MNRLTSGTVSLFALLLVGACNNDPVSDLDNDQIAQLTVQPSTLNVTHGKTSKFQVTAVNAAGNPIKSAYEITNVGPGLTVVRDSSFFPIFVGNNNTLTVPPEATTFQYVVTGNDLTSSSITVSAGGKDVTVPVIVLPDPSADTLAVTATPSGTTARDTITLTVPAPYQFGSTVSAAFDAGTGVVVGAPDASTLKVLAPPGSTTGQVNGVVLPFASNIPLTNPQVMTPPFAIDPTLTALPGTANPNTAPEIAAPDIGGHAGIIDVGNFSGSDITGDGGVGAQYYKFTIATAGDYTFTMDWNNDADLDPVVCFDAACSDGAFAGTGTDQPEQGTLTLQPGTYYFAVVLFAQGASATNPDFFSLQIDAAPPSPPEGGLRAPVSTKSLHSGRVHLVRNGAS